MTRALRLFCALAGLCDATTGLLLMLAPHVTLGLMGIAPTAEPTLIRFIGAFVAGIGLAYWHPWWGRAGADPAGLTTMLEITALCRTAVGLFVITALFQGWLVPAWGLVAATDLGLAGAQMVYLRRASPFQRAVQEAVQGARS